MDHSTDNVTVMGEFFLPILEIYKGRVTILDSIQEIIKDLDLSDPKKMHPMQKYNEVLDWIDDNLGRANAVITGKTIGNPIFDYLTGGGMIKQDANPSEIMRALDSLARIVISDPKDRGWEFLADEPTRLVMRKTQTFNANIQCGVLEGLLSRCKSVRNPQVRLIAEVKNGAEFDDYELSWFYL